MAAANKSWNLQSFLDSLVYELDQARETLAVKGVNRPLTYAVKDLSLDLNLFPEYNGSEVKFTTAKPGDTGASRIGITLGSITDRQIRETTKLPPQVDDVSLDEVEEIDEETKQSLKKIGIDSINDIERLEEKKIDLKKVKGVSPGNYSRLADKLKKIRTETRANAQTRVVEEVDIQEENPVNKENRDHIEVKDVVPVEKVGIKKPVLKAFKLEIEGNYGLIKLVGENLNGTADFLLRAFFNSKEVEIQEQSGQQLILKVHRSLFTSKSNQLELMLDEDTIVKMTIK